MGSTRQGALFICEADDDPWLLFSTFYDEDQHTIAFEQHDTELSHFGISAAAAREMAAAAAAIPPSLRRT